MAILVTGGAGYIGSHTVVELLNLGKEVVIVDNLSNSSILVLDRIEAITGQRPAFYELDVCDKQGLRKVFEQESIEAAIHFAGYKAVGESVQKPVMYYENNIMSTLALVEVMSEFNVKKIVFSSSATVYGVHNQSPLIETMPTSATNPYGYTKVMLEQILKDVHVADSEWSIALLRYFNPIGAHESGLIGEDPSGIPNNLMPFIAQVAVGKRPELSVFGDDYYLEIQANGIEEQKIVNQKIVKLSKELDIPLVVTNDVHYTCREDVEAQDILICIQTGKKIDDEDRMKIDVDTLYIKSPEEIKKEFVNFPEALENTVKIAEKCNFEFEFGNTKLPNFDTPNGEKHEEYLKQKTYEGIVKKYGENYVENKEIVDRIKYELDVIIKMGYTDYFLIVWDFITYAKSQKIPVGPRKRFWSRINCCICTRYNRY